MIRTCTSRFALALACAASSAAAPAPAQERTRPDTAGVRDLRDVLATGWILQDRNGDDVIDFVHARIILPSTPSEAEVTSAANIAARLGYETSATNPGLAISADVAPTVLDVPAILIGSARDLLVARAAPAPPTLALAPAMGVITFLPPGPVLRAGGILLDGYDATGLLAAAEYWSARYPSVWSLRGDTYAQLMQRLERFLADRGVAGAEVLLRQIVVEAGRQGVSRAVAVVRVADSTAFALAAAALEPPHSAVRDTVARDTATRDTVARRGQAADSARGGPAEILSTDLHRLDIELGASGRSRAVRLLPRRPWPERAATEFTARATPDFTLSDLYTIRGLFRDTNQDFVPDRTEAYLSVQGAAAAGGLIDFAQRVGLETAGMRLPIARLGGQEDRPQDRGFPIIHGIGHDQLERLRDDHALHGLTEGDGVGFMQFVPKGFGGRHGLVIGAADARGLDAIDAWVARRLPFLWGYGKGEYRLADVENEVRRFFQVRDAPGQAALALVKLDQWLARLASRDIDSIAVEIAARETPAALALEIERRVRARFPRTQYCIARGIDFPREIQFLFEDRFSHAKARWVRCGSDTGEALPRLTATSRGRIEVRVSEPASVRAALATEIRDAIAHRGLPEDAFDVVVLGAYKQGYGWIEERVLPKLRGRRIGRIEISYHTLRDSREVRWQTVESDTRWLQELYPIDAILARELGIPDSLVVFKPTRDRAPIYAIRVLDPAGREILRDTFDPKYVVRPFFDLFPEYERVRVTTGWVTVVAGTDTLLDRRIVTDPEAFWEHLQTRTFARINDYVMDVQDGRPSPGNAPFFDELNIDLTLSEPDARIGVDEEVISSLEALHEDIYFETLTLFDLIGARYGVGGLDFAGRVLPWIHDGVGRPGHARIRFTGKDRAVPELILTWRERGAQPVRDRYALAPLSVPTPMLRGASVRAGEDGLAQLLFQVAAIDSVDRYNEYRDRSSESGIDRTFLPVELLDGMVRALQDLHAAGMFEDALSLDRVAEIAFHFTLQDSTRTFHRDAAVWRTAHPRSTRNPVLYAEGYEHDARRIVQWQTPIPPFENDSVLAKLATFPGVNVYFMTKSFLGQNTFAADFLPPHDATYISQAKLNALKPTLLLSGRQHANEVSSTSHILRLGELLATDSSYSRLLNHVNVVLHPITNPDGARLAYEMQLENPDFMLHAGYLGALGVDATSGANSDDPIYPESKARPELQNTWLPDIYINMHGYPSHEWVQYFAGYSAWVRGRTGGQRSWWSPRGWFIPGFSWVHDDRYPEIERAQFAILDSIAAAITGDPRIDAINRRMYARYQKYGRQDVENFREYFHRGILVYSALRGREATGTGVNSPRVTYFSITTEAPDETARGEWLDLVASAGLAHSSALLRYLAAGQNRIERETTEYDAFVMRSVFRKKPVLPK